MTSATFSTDVEILPGYYVDLESGSWRTLPWPGERSLPWNHPDRLKLLPPSLGPGAIRWAEANLVHHLTGNPWRYTAGQKRFLILWYSLTPEARFAYRSGVKRGAKGTGKDPFGAAWLLTEMLGPVRFAGWEGERPAGQAHRLPLVQIAANSEAQAADVLRVANALLPRETRETYGIDCGQTRTVLVGGGRMELLTASQMSAEGDPATAIMLNESHHMTQSNGGHKVAEVARRNVGKSPADLQARLIEFTNAHEEGEDSVAEQSYKAFQAQASGKALRSDILYDSIESHPGVDIYNETSRRAGLTAAYSDAPWRDEIRLEDEVLDPRTSVSQGLRFYFNVIAANEEAWVEPAKFDACAVTEVVADKSEIALFLDCSKSSDATALMGCRISDGYVMTIQVWQKPAGARGATWLVPRPEVDALVRQCFQRYRVVWFGVDPSPAKDDETESSYWVGLIDQWHRDFRESLQLWTTSAHACMFDMRLSSPGGHARNREFVEAAQQAQADIDASTDSMRLFIHDGDSVLRAHAHNARNHPTNWGISVGKVNRNSNKLVDAVVAAVGARMGRKLWLNSGKASVKKSGKVWGLMP